MKTTTDGAKLDELVAALREAGAWFAYLIGSRAEGTAREDPDIDERVRWEVTIRKVCLDEKPRTEQPTRAFVRGPGSAESAHGPMVDPERLRRLLQSVNQRGGQLGRRMLRTARRLAAQEPLFVQVASGNAASLRTFLAAGSVPLGAEVLFPRRPGT